MGGGDQPHLPDVYPGEIESLVEAGLSPIEALRAATSTGARALGVQHQVGAIRVGLFGDLVLLDSDPRQDISNIRRIMAVVKGGVTHWP